MKNVFVIFVVVLVATVAAKKGWKNRQRQQCKYDKSAWSDCDTKTSTVSRVLTLKSGDEGCQQTQNQTITCDRFDRLQAWKIKKAESRRELQEKKHQRNERQQEMNENKQLVKEQLKRCRYDHSDWSECDQATNTVTRNFTLSEGEQGCEQSHTTTITCDKLNRIQAWKTKKRDRKQNRIDEKLQMKQERKEKRKLEKEQRLKCKYDKEDWSECDNTTNTVTRVMTLRDGEEEECEPIINVIISCSKFERIQQWKARKMERKNEKKQNKMFIREQKNMWKENKKIVKEQRRHCTMKSMQFSEQDTSTDQKQSFHWGKADDRNCIHGHPKMLDEKLVGCNFDVTFSECDPTTNMVTKSYIPTTDDDDSCENRSFEYSCDLHERLMEKKRKRQDKRVNRKINRKEFRQQRLLI